MSRLLRRIGVGLAAVFVVGGLSFGASQAFGSGMRTVCNGPEQLGTCPPFSGGLGGSCNFWCGIHFGTGGDCIQGCCTCLV